MTLKSTEQKNYRRKKEDRRGFRWSGRSVGRSVGQSANVKLNQEPPAVPPQSGWFMLHVLCKCSIRHPLRSRFETINSTVITEGHLKALSPYHRHRNSLVQLSRNVRIAFKVFSNRRSDTMQLTYFFFVTATMAVGSSIASSSHQNRRVLSMAGGGKASQMSPIYSNALNLRAGSSKGGLFADTIQGLKDRAAYDSKFTTKLSVELCVGFVTQLIAEYSKRGSKPLLEIDFVIADLVMGLSANFFAVYLSAPVLQNTKTSLTDAKLSKFSTFLAGCPDNTFQRCTPGTSFSILQRIFAMIKVAPKLFVIGFIAMALGTGFTTALGLARSIVQNGIKSVGAETIISKAAADGVIDLVKNSLAIGLYLAVSTNLRYQVVAGIFESRVIDPLFGKFPFIQGVGSFIIRTINTYVGSAMMVDFLRLMGQP